MENQVINRAPKDKEYLLLISFYERHNQIVDGNSEEIEIRDWQFVLGREEAWITLKNYIIDDLIDPFESYVIVETVGLSDRLTVAEFMKHVRRYFETDSFNIKDYIEEDQYEALLSEEELYAIAKTGLTPIGEFINPASEIDVGVLDKDEV